MVQPQIHPGCALQHTIKEWTKADNILGAVVQNRHTLFFAPGSARQDQRSHVPFFIWYEIGETKVIKCMH